MTDISAEKSDETPTLLRSVAMVVPPGRPEKKTPEDVKNASGAAVASRTMVELQKLFPPSSKDSMHPGVVLGVVLGGAALVREADGVRVKEEEAPARKMHAASALARRIPPMKRDAVIRGREAEY